MKVLKSLVKQKCFEEGIKKTVEFVAGEEGRVNGMICPEFGSVSEEKRGITLEYRIRDWEANTNNVMHGGICATIMDTTLGILANYLCIGGGKTFAPTVSMTVNYLRPIPLEETLCVDAKITSFGKNLITLYGEAYLKGTTDLAATATATYITLSVGPKVGQVLCPL